MKYKTDLHISTNVDLRSFSTCFKGTANKGGI